MTSPSPARNPMPSPTPAPARGPAVTAMLPATSAGSPALELQHRLRRELIETGLAPDDRFPLPARVAIAIGTSAALWAAIIAGGRALLG